jgi:predicted permease
MFRKLQRTDQDFEEEIQAHLQIEADRLMADGMSRVDAMAAARRTFGNVTSSREQFYESGRWMWLDHLTADVRYALRQVRSSPGTTATIVLSLALGIGVNTAIFSLADQALVRVLPVEKPEQLVLLDWHGRFVGGGVGSDNLFSNPFYQELRKENDVFEDVFARHPTDVHLSFGGESGPASAEIVSGSYFPALGVRPAIGRLLGDADDLKPGADPVAVLSYDYWRNRFGADPEIVGKRVLVNNYPMTVVGVAAQGFRGVDWGTVPVIWIPIMMKRQATPGWDALFDRRTKWLHVFGRLKPGISRQQAEARLQPWFKAYLRADTRREGWPPVTDAQMREYLASRLDVLPAAQGRSDRRIILRQPMLILLAATCLILLLACLNVTNLSLAKALGRRRTTALKAALGASRRRILTEQLVESSLLAVAGSVAGILLAPLVSRAMLSFVPGQEGAGVALSADLDPRVLLFALAITALTAILSGAAPALYATSIQPVTALKQESSAVAGGLGLRKALVVGQFALALILLIGAGLFARTLGSLRVQGPGFPTANLLMFRVDLLSDGYDDAKAKPTMRRLLAEIQGLLEVEQAGAAGFEMLRGGGWNNPVTVQSKRRILTEDLPMNAVSPGFFGALGARLTRGRDFNERDSRDDAGASRSVIVNEEFVKRYCQDFDPLGARLGIGDRPDTIASKEIVGVVRSFHDFGLRKPEAEVFFPLWEGSVSGGTFYVRSRRSSQAAARSIRTAVARIDPKVTVLSFRTIDDQLDRMLTNERMLAGLAGAFAGVATLLAMIGLYGVLSFSAARRTKEIGIRLALGAPRWAAGGLIVREAAVLAAVGLAIAIPVSWALGRLIENQLFGVGPMDAMTIAGAAAVLALVCLATSAVPARRVGSVSPLETLRSE